MPTSVSIASTRLTMVYSYSDSNRETTTEVVVYWHEVLTAELKMKHYFWLVSVSKSEQ